MDEQIDLRKVKTKNLYLKRFRTSCSSLSYAWHSAKEDAKEMAQQYGTKHYIVKTAVNGISVEQFFEEEKRLIWIVHIFLFKSVDEKMEFYRRTDPDAYKYMLKRPTSGLELLNLLN